MACLSGCHLSYLVPIYLYLYLSIYLYLSTLRQRFFWFRCLSPPSLTETVLTADERVRLP